MPTFLMLFSMELHMYKAAAHPINVLPSVIGKNKSGMAKKV